MKLFKIRIQNFRSLEDVSINIDDYTTFVGPNGAGKSNILTALNVFFRNKTSALPSDWILREDDFYQKNISRPIIITLSFTELSDAAKGDFKAYYRNNELVVSAKAEWNASNGGAEVKQIGHRNVIKEFGTFFDDSKSVAQLKAIYQDLRSAFTELPPAATKAAMETALRAYEESHPEKCSLLESHDMFYGWSKGSNLLHQYVQWTYIPAVKEAATEQDESKNTALGILLGRTIRSKVKFDDEINKLKEGIESGYKKMLDGQDAALRDISRTLENRLHQFASPDTSVQLKWYYDPQKSLIVQDPFARALIGESGFVGEIAKLGHGLQRAFILSLLQELATSSEEDAPTLLLGVEEPELYQHPPQARHLAAVLENLARNKTQVFITTHSPYFVSPNSYNGIRRIHRKTGTGPSQVEEMSIAGVVKRLNDSLTCREILTPTALMAKIDTIMHPTQNELFFTFLPVMVEGDEDVAFIATYMELAGLWQEFRQYGCHFILASGKTKMSRPLAIAQELKIPVFCIFDSDIPCRTEDMQKNIKDNTCLLNLCSITPIPTSWDQSCEYANAQVLSPNLAAVVKNEVGLDNWVGASQLCQNTYGLNGVSEKTPDLVSAILEHLWKNSLKSETLIGLCGRILSYARCEKRF